MTTLISKIQYKNFEIGEFTEIRERSYEETISLIESFPWSKQRERIVIDLTNPSITIQGRNDDYLKCALYYNQKYILRYLNADGILFTKSFTDIKNTYIYIKQFFEQQEFDTSDFKKESAWMQHPLEHFLTQDFIYLLTRKTQQQYAFSTGFTFFLAVIVIIFLLFQIQHWTNALWLVILLPVILLTIQSRINIALFNNYNNYSKDKILIMSKGNDIFYFGNYDQPVQYHKKDILRFTVYRPWGGEGEHHIFAAVFIELKNGEVLKIPNFLIDHNALAYKLSGYTKIEKFRPPFIK